MQFLENMSIRKSPPFFCPLLFVERIYIYIVSEAGATLPFRDHTEFFGDQILAV